MTWVIDADEDGMFIIENKGINDRGLMVYVPDDDYEAHAEAICKFMARRMAALARTPPEGPREEGD